MDSIVRPLAAEFVGTFALIFIGAGAGTVLGAGQLPGIAFAHGLTIMVMAVAFGDISGSHINPAVTAGLAAAGEFPLWRVIPYWIAQIAGAILAGFSLLFIFGGPVNHLGATLVDTQRITYSAAFALEAVGTFFLVNTVLHAAVRKAVGQLAPFAIGMTVTVCILMFGALTGASVNPARTIGPAVAAGAYDGIMVYLIAQLVGGVTAGVLYRTFWIARSASPLPQGASPAAHK
jgi:MIP family channel proteins